MAEIQQKILDAQAQLMEAQRQLAELNVEEWNPNADEALLAYYDAGQKALGLANQALTMVADFLNNLFDG